jgi:hypothetical protein
MSLINVLFSLSNAWVCSAVYSGRTGGVESGRVCSSISLKSTSHPSPLGFLGGLVTSPVIKYLNKINREHPYNSCFFRLCASLAVIISLCRFAASMSF